MPFRLSLSLCLSLSLSLLRSAPVPGDRAVAAEKALREQVPGAEAGPTWPGRGAVALAVSLCCFIVKKTCFVLL